jgi:hypothetical protein
LAHSDEVVGLGLGGDGLAAQEPHDDVEVHLEQLAGVGGVEPDHRGVGGQRARPQAEHHAAAREVVEQHDALGGPQRVVVAHRDDAGAQLDVLRALGRGRDEDLRRRDDLRARRVVLADPRLVEAHFVEVLDEPQVPVDRCGGVHARGVEGGQEGAETQPAHGCSCRR